MKRLAVLAFALTLVSFLAVGSLTATKARADGIEVRSIAAANRFPDGAAFTIFTASNADITSVRLKFRLLPDGSVSFARPQCTTGTVVNCTAVVGDTRQSYMVPGAEIVYSWEIEDAAGQKLESQQSNFTYTDSRFQWESISDRNVTVYYHFGDDATNQAVLRTARETIDRISALEATQVDFPVKVWVYQTAREMQPALGNRNIAGAGQVLGEVGAPDTALVSRDQDFLNVVRHELAHVVTRRATRGLQGEVPPWVNEGISTYAQSRLLPGEEVAFAQAVRGNRMLPISSLSSAIRGADFPLAYAQSGSIVTYLVNTHGQERFAQFIAALGRENTDGALRSVYNVDQFGLENEWRRSLGLPPVTDTGARPGADQPFPTIVPFGAGQPASTPASGAGSGPAASSESSEGGGSGAGLLIAGVVIAVLIVAGGGYYYIWRRNRATAQD